MCLAMIFIMAMVFCVPSLSQPLSPKEIRDNKGREFWITFPENDHGTFNAQRTDSLYFFIATERPTRVTIRFLLDNSTREFTLRNTNEMRIIGYPFARHELRGRERVEREVFQITSDEEITVYGMNFADRTTDAFLAFPKDVLGREYFVFTYQSNLLRPSNFSIIATEPDTEIEINPSRPTARFGMMPQRFMLQQGDAYYVTPLLQRGLQDTTDLTGTRIRSNKPIAVYAGHQRANIIYDIPRPGDVPRTQDYIMEQMLPTNVWRNTCFVVPVTQPGPFVSFRLPRPDSSRSDIVRILAAQDSTIIAINEAPSATLQNTTLPTVRLNTGQYYEMLVGQPAVVRANKPIAAMLYRKSGNGGSFGDPFMAALPPVEQYLNRYKYINVQGEQSFQLRPGLFRFGEAFVEHYVSVVIPTVKINTIRVNGSPLNGVVFRPIAETGYSYGLMGSEATVYDITADTTFGITVYGYGEANSYGYIGGMRFETDTIAPRVRVIPGCFQVSGKIYDDLIDDSKIFWYEVPDTSRRNVRVQFDNLPRPADSLAFQARLINRFEDGEFALNTTDSLDLLTRRRYFIPGFTVHVNANFRRNEIVQLSSSAIALAAGLERCFDLTLTNYGATTQTISTIDFAGRNGLPQREFYSTTTLPIVLAPREQRRINLCFRADTDGFFLDTLRVGNACVMRPIAAIEVESGFDRTAPVTVRRVDSCARTVTYRFTDSHRYASGVADVTFQAAELQNATVATVRNPDGSITGVATLTNPRRDGIVRFVVRDSVGNSRVVQDTLQGFPLRLVFTSPSLPASAQNRFGQVNFLTTDAGTTTCQTVQAWNDGVLPLVLNVPFLENNTIFSAPLSQFPLRIPPGQFRPLSVCFSPELIQSYRDTLTITRFCDVEILALRGEGGLRILEGMSRCSVGVRLIPRVGANLSAYFPGQNSIGSNNALNVTHRPNPASNEVMLHLDNIVAGHYTLKIYTVLGMEISNLRFYNDAPANGELVIDTHALESGTYFYSLQSHAITRSGVLRISK